MYDQYALLDQLCLTLYVVPLPVPLPAYLVARFIDAALLGASSVRKNVIPAHFWRWHLYVSMRAYILDGTNAFWVVCVHPAPMATTVGMRQWW